jgi:hypothetical protein
MLPPFRPAVFACPMRYIHDEKPKRGWPPPYPAWPEITDPSGFYTLPTLASYPAITKCEYSPRWLLFALDADSAKYLTDREVIYLMFPDDAEEILAKLPPTTENIYMATLRLLDRQTLSMGDVRLFGAMGSADPEWSVFAYLHEIGHYLSFQTPRPTIMEVNRIASGVFDLFKQLSLSNFPICKNFWDEFEKGNDALLRYLDQALILEELRANLYALSDLDPIIRANIEPDLRKAMAEGDAISLFGKPILRTVLFDRLADGMIEGLLAAYWLTIMAEFSPKDPLKRLDFLCRKGVDASSKMLLKVAVHRSNKGGWEVNLVEPKHGTPEIRFTPLPLNEDAVSVLHHLSLSDVRELVFLESLRQQLAQFFGVSLVCPFQQRGRTCCGFGHYLRAVWEQVRPEHRSAKAVLHPKTGKEIVVRPPRTVCLHYGLS